MARRKKKKKRKSLGHKKPKDVIAPETKPEGFLVADSAIWWEANADKSKKYGNKEFKGKKELTPKEAEKFLGVTSAWLCIFMAGAKGFPKLTFTWKDKNPATVRFARADLVKYRDMLPSRKYSTKARPQQK